MTRTGHWLQLSGADQLSCDPPPRPCGAFSRARQRQNTRHGCTRRFRPFSGLAGSVFCGPENTLPHFAGAGRKSLTGAYFTATMRAVVTRVMPLKRPP